MFKKLIIIIPILGIIIAALVQGTSGRFAVGQPGQRVVLTTDAGVIFDRSFNENSFLGVREFLQDKYELDGSKNNYVDAAENTKIGLLNNYKLGLLKNADALVMPGFAHIEALSDPASNFLKDKTVVLVDAELTDPERNKNVISVIFNAELSGLQAGFDASYWATRKVDGKLQGDINQDNEIVIGTFGGASAKTSVNNFMFGMFLGMELFNLIIGQQEGVSVGFANSTVGNSLEGMNPNGANDSNFFSGTFALGDAVRSGILTRLVDTKHADIIFPVAGPQIQEVISYEAKPYNGLSGYKPYVIGIDVDQTVTYPAAAKDGRFLNSAVKNLHTAVYQSLSHAKNLRQANNEDGSLGELNPPDDSWEGRKAVVARNWSESTVGGDNLIQKHALLLYTNETEATQPFGNTPIDVVLKRIMDLFAKAGNNPRDHLKGSFIKDVANQVKDDVEKNLVVKDSQGEQ